MKRVLTVILSLSVLFLSTNESLKLNADEEYSIAIKEENNLATWKYDWDTVGIGAGKVGFESGNLRMENINSASSNFALYKTNKFNEFRLDMYANLNLLSPSDTNYEAQFDYANLYLTTFIDYDDASAVENVAMAACPWEKNKGWFSICFERIQGKSYVQMLINEAFDGNGANRYFCNSNNVNEGSVEANINWCDNQYHWYTIEATSTHAKNPTRPRPAEMGTTFKVYIDGILQTTYFQSNAYYSNTNKRDEIIPFDTQKGYVGFWASSGYSASATTENTGVFVDIRQLQITSYDDLGKDNALPYTICSKPSFKLDPINNFSPAAQYELDEDIEIKLSELFTYDGDKKLTYSATCDGEEIGAIRNGYFVWTPEKEGIYKISFNATDGELQARNDVRLRVVSNEIEIKPSSPEISENPSETPISTSNSENKDLEQETTKKGCKGGLSSMSFLSFALIFLLTILKRKK